MATTNWPRIARQRSGTNAIIKHAWIAAGQGRADDDGMANADENNGEEFTFTPESRVDREGNTVSEEWRAENPIRGVFGATALSWVFMATGRRNIANFIGARDTDDPHQEPRR